MGRTDRVKSRTRSSCKKRFCGNQHTKVEMEAEQQQQTDQNISSDQTDQNLSSNHINDTPNETVSGSKVEHISTDTPKHSDPIITGYRFIDVEILSDIITILCCPECKSSGLTLHENFNQKKGFASLLLLKCKCGFVK